MSVLFRLFKRCSVSPNSFSICCCCTRFEYLLRPPERQLNSLWLQINTAQKSWLISTFFFLIEFSFNVSKTSEANKPHRSLLNSCPVSPLSAVYLYPNLRPHCYNREMKINPQYTTLDVSVRFSATGTGGSSLRVRGFCSPQDMNLL